LERSLKDYRRIVIKIGASLLTSKEGLDCVISQIAGFIRDKRQVILVSSGAIAFGMKTLGLKTRPSRLDQLQAAASLGQNELMRFYADKFEPYDIKTAQILLTWEDFNDRTRYLNSKHTIEALLGWSALPIINENDTVSVEEIRFGDNDRLSALVANLVGADILIILSDVEGLLDRNGQVVRMVEQITPSIERLASPTDKEFCVGGMKTKISAAKIAVESSIPCIIVDGKKSTGLTLALSRPFEAGTIFLPKERSLSAAKRWVVFCAKPKGQIWVDDGAKKALLNNKSLLSVGLIRYEGKFNHGDIVDISDSKDEVFGRGKVNFSSQDLDKVKGLQKMKEVIHKDDLVILRT